MDNGSPLQNTETQPKQQAAVPSRINERPKQPHPLKKLAMNTMIGSLIGSALIAVAAVLAGEFNDIFQKSLFTLLVVTVHALACLGFLDSREKSKDSEDLKVFTNTVFILIILSFITAVFGIWGLLAGSIVAKLYGTYFIVLFATLHGEMLYKTTGVDSRIDKLVASNYALMGLVVLLLLPILWLAPDSEFPDFYYRLLTAAAIVDATLTILAVIFHRLYLQKHPKANSQLFAQTTYVVDESGNKVPVSPVEAKRRTHPLLIILIIFLFLQFVAPLSYFLIGLIATQ